MPLEPRRWTLHIIQPLRPAIEDGSKKIDLRVKNPRNDWLIQKMLRYEIGDVLRLRIMNRRVVETTIDTQITKPTTQKPLGELDDEEIALIGGSVFPDVTRRQIITLMNNLNRGVDVDENTTGYLAHFELK